MNCKPMTVIGAASELECNFAYQIFASSSIFFFFLFYNIRLLHVQSDRVTFGTSDESVCPLSVCSVEYLGVNGLWNGSVRPVLWGPAPCRTPSRKRCLISANTLTPRTVFPPFRTADNPFGSQCKEKKSLCWFYIS